MVTQKEKKIASSLQKQMQQLTQEILSGYKDRIMDDVVRPAQKNLRNIHSSFDLVKEIEVLQSNIQNYKKEFNSIIF